ncbi:unnamed protein product [Scytosiphon promiscuus]
MLKTTTGMRGAKSNTVAMALAQGSARGCDSTFHGHSSPGEGMTIPVDDARGDLKQVQKSMHVPLTRSIPRVRQSIWRCSHPPEMPRIAKVQSAKILRLSGSWRVTKPAARHPSSRSNTRSRRLCRVEILCT